jgi:hypothetical protein
MRRAWHALAAYLGITFVATWPLALGLAKDVAWDIGDSALNMWVLAWDCEQLLAIMHGNFSRIGSFFDGNIFHPAPLTISYAEHLFPQAVQILPIYALTRNPILCYNLLTLSAFVLSGLGMYLFMRELTGNAKAAFVAGLLFAFAPYRVAQTGHLPVISSQWMPFVLYGFRRYFAARQAGAGGWRPLAGATVALIAQNLSCGYYLLYFPPFAAAYVAWELLRLQLTRHGRTWIQLIVAAVCVAIATAPFVLPYAALRQQFKFERTATEVNRFSADVYSYATADEKQLLWGSTLREFPKPEGGLFPGIVVTVLVLVAIAAWRPPRLQPARSRLPARFSWLVPTLTVVAALHILLAGITLLNRRVNTQIAGVDLQITDIDQLLLRAVILMVLIFALSPMARARARAFLSERGFFLAALIAAVWLSFGLTVEVRGRPAHLSSVYAFFFDHVPGFEGLRVPSRYATIAALMAAVLAGYAVAALSGRARQQWWVAALCVVGLAEAVVLPFPTNMVHEAMGYHRPEPRLYRPARAPAVYREFAAMQGHPVLADLPLGEPEFDQRAVYYSTVHWRPLLNGYSGFYPPHYGALALALSDVPRFPDEAVRALRVYGATHAIVHEGAFLEQRGAATTQALIARGAREVFRDGAEVLLQLPPP